MPGESSPETPADPTTQNTPSVTQANPPKSAAPTDPAPTDPAPTDPAPTDPAPNDPAPNDPAPTDPAKNAPDTAPASLATRQQGSDWKTFLGPTADSKSTETGPLTQWPQEGLRIV